LLEPTTDSALKTYPEDSFDETIDGREKEYASARWNH
jgi:hypothetical protein